MIRIYSYSFHIHFVTTNFTCRNNLDFERSAEHRCDTSRYNETVSTDDLKETPTLSPVKIVNQIAFSLPRARAHTQTAYDSLNFTVIARGDSSVGARLYRVVLSTINVVSQLCISLSASQRVPNSLYDDIHSEGEEVDKTSKLSRIPAGSFRW